MPLLHPAGRRQIAFAVILFIAFLINSILADWDLWALILFLIPAGWLIFTLQFFRYPKRTLAHAQKGEIYAPADGKIVVVEVVDEEKHFNEQRTQVSIFMSPVNVHVNWTPCSGEVLKADHVPGQYLFAAHPKSSELNERSEVIIQHEEDQIYIKQIAGVMARRIICNLSPNQSLEYGDEIGFIKFGSRVDLLLPLDYEIMSHIGDMVTGNKTLIAKKK